MLYINFTHGDGMNFEIEVHTSTNSHRHQCTF